MRPRLFVAFGRTSPSRPASPGGPTIANFRHHLLAGLGVGIGGALGGMAAAGLSFAQAALTVILGAVAGILPDVDSDNSKSARILFSYLGVLVPLVLYLRLSQSPRFTLDALLLVGLGGYVLIRYGLAHVFFGLTTHRGTFHSIPAAVVCGECTFILFRDLPALARLALALTCAAAYLTHLVLDELSSVNLEDRRIKASAGTALTLRGASALDTLSVYLLIALLARIAATS